MFTEPHQPPAKKFSVRRVPVLESDMYPGYQYCNRQQTEESPVAQFQNEPTVKANKPPVRNEVNQAQQESPNQQNQPNLHNQGPSALPKEPVYEPYENSVPLGVDRGERNEKIQLLINITPAKMKYQDRPDPRSVGVPISPYVQLNKLNQGNRIPDTKVISEILKERKVIESGRISEKSNGDDNMNYLVPNPYR